MARLTPELWEKIRLDYEVKGKSYGELSQKYGINKSNISRRAQKEAWNQKATQEIIAQVVDNQKQLIEIENKTQHLNATQRNAIMRESFDRLSFEIQSNERMEALTAHAVMLGLASERVAEVKAAMDVVKTQREALLGKAPDTAIQINHHHSGSSAIDALFEERLNDAG